MNDIDDNLDTEALDPNDNFILDSECMNKKYSFKAIYSSDYGNGRLMNYIPGEITDMIVDGIQENEGQYQNNWYTFHSFGNHNHIVCILMNMTNCTSLEYLFSDIQELVSISFTPDFNAENLEHLDFMFMGCSSLISINFSNLNTKNLKTMEGMFHSCISLQSMDFSNLDLRNVEIMYKFCFWCDSLVSVNFTNTHTLNLTSYPGMFGDCFNLTSVELTNFKTRNMDMMFDHCPSLRYIDIRSINCKPEYVGRYAWIGYVPNNGTLIINNNCSNVIQNSFPNWTVIID